MAQAQTQAQAEVAAPLLSDADALAAQFEQLLQAGRFPAAIAVAEELELALAEEGKTLAAEAFFVQQMATLLVLQDLTNAKHLWKRLPNEIKANDSLAKLWNVAKHLMHMNLAEAYVQLGSTWDAPADTLVPRIIDSVRQSQLWLIGRAYSKISLEKLAVALGLDQSEAASQVAALGWSVSATDGTVIPTRTADIFSEERAQGVEADQQRLQQMAQYLQLFEQKALEVDLSSRSTAAPSHPSLPVEFGGR